MAYELVRTKSLKSAVAFSQFVFMQVDSSGLANLPVAGGYSHGVIQDKPQIGDPTAICFPGDITKVLANGTIALGGLVSTDQNGNAVPATPGTVVLGIALTAGAAGYLMDIIYQPGSTTGIDASLGSNYIATENGANNAIACAAGSGPALQAGLLVTIQLAHSLQAGANTFAYNGGAAVAIKEGTNAANNLGAGVVATALVSLQYDGTVWRLIGQ